MKTVIKAALLLSVSFFFSQASLAGGNGKPDKDVPPPKDYCDFSLPQATSCAGELLHAHNQLESYRDAFKSDRDFKALACKVEAADLKIAADKPGDAELKLSDSVTKIETLHSQDKLNVDYDTMSAISGAMEDARACAYSLIPTAP